MSNVIYPFDPYGNSDENIVEREFSATRPVITDDPATDKRYNFIVPKFAPFYKDDFEMYSVDEGRKLVEGIDFYFTHRFDQAQDQTRKPVYGSVTFISRFYDSEIEYRKYRCVGGIWSLNEQALAELLAKRLLDPRQTLWENVVNLPDTFPVIDHDHDINDTTTYQDLINSVDKIPEAILAAADRADGQQPVDGIEYGSVPRIQIEANYDLGKRWMMLGTLDISDDGPLVTSDLGLTINGLEPLNTVESSLIFLTFGHSITMQDTDNDPNTPDTRVVDGKLHVVNVTQYVTPIRFGWRHTYEPMINRDRIELWMELVDEHGEISIVDNTSQDGFMWGNTYLTTEPMNVNWAEMLQLGNTPAADSLKLGGYNADQYAMWSDMTAIINTLTEKLNHLANGGSTTPEEWGPERFISREYWAATINDYIADMDAVVDYVRTGTGNLPPAVSVPDPYQDTPTGEPSFFISRTEVSQALNMIRSAFDAHIDELIGQGLVLNKQDLIARIVPPSSFNVPFPPYSTETSTQMAAINYFANEEMEQLNNELTFVINSVITAAGNP